MIHGFNALSLNSGRRLNGTWQAYSKIYMKEDKANNSQDTLEDQVSVKSSHKGIGQWHSAESLEKRSHKLWTLWITSSMGAEGEKK